MNQNEQNRLMLAIAGICSDREFTDPGLEAYQNNLKANAARALSISFPIIFELLGEPFFQQVSNRFLEQYPLNKGDWGEWGDTFPKWIEKHPVSEEHPYLADTAHLEWLAHRCERASDSIASPESFELLASPDAGAGRFTFQTGLSLVESRYPIVDIWQAHKSDPIDKASYLHKAKVHLQNGQGQTALLWRQKWRAMVCNISPAETRWMQQILANASVEEALTHCDSDFSFEKWLPQAISQQIVTGFQL